MQNLSQRDVDRLIAQGEKLFFEPPAFTMRSYVNKRTGEVSTVPDGIDPGWAYNPGRASQAARNSSALAAKQRNPPWLPG